jgi:hypothetical protein
VSVQETNTVFNLEAVLKCQIKFVLTLIYHTQSILVRSGFI